MYNPNPPGGSVPPEAWDQYVQTIQEAITATSGWEQKKLEAQYADAAKGRENAYKIAQLTTDASRYGTDASREVALARLKQEAKQFEATHALDIAKTATEYLSTPDRYFQASSFLNMANRQAQGARPGPYGVGSSPQPKTMADFNTLYTGGGSPDGRADPVPTGSAPNFYTGATSSSASGGGSSGATQTDPRQAVTQAVVKNLPPSQENGLNDLDFAALTAIKSMYETPLRPGTVERMTSGQQAMLASGGKRLGWDVGSWQDQYLRNRPNQGSVRAA